MDTASVIIITGICFYLITCLAILDIVRKDFSSLIEKAAWGFISMVPFIGCLIYFIFGFRRGQKKTKQPLPQNNN
jgi:hypothetical protein